MMYNFDDSAPICAVSDPPDARVLPIPAVLDAGAAVLLHLLLDQNPSRPVILDAVGLRELCAVGALLLASALRAHARTGVPPRIINLSERMRRELSRHPLLEFAGCATHNRLFRVEDTPGQCVEQEL